MPKLAELRKQIEEIDKDLVEKLDKRTELAKEIGKVKSKESLPVYDTSQETEVVNRAKDFAKKMPKTEVESVFREIMSASRSAQQKMKIAYLGPKTTFTHMAAIKEFGKSSEYIAQDSTEDIFASVEKGNSDFGVVPVENSTEGTVNNTLDMFTSSDLNIIGEISLPIMHNLIGKGKLSDIKKVYSHPQAFAQCRKWIAKNLPKTELIETSSTTKGAESANIYHSSAAIASKLASEEFGLSVLAENIGDNAKNITRFLIIGKSNSHMKATGKDKTSIMFSVKHEPGSLFNALKPLHDNDVNMTKIESRPTRMKTWEYVFFVDVQGFKDDKKIMKVLEEMGKYCGFIKVLGSYPERTVSE